tara:strand:+ start:4933 stop:6360 length:1428 start_codon:yes stop_codon:yes gene_type:complete
MGDNPVRAFAGGGVGDSTSLRTRVFGAGRILYSAVVEEFISNPSHVTEDQILKYGEGGPKQVQNLSQLERMPRGSIIATIVSDQAAKASSKPIIFFPMFSHLSLPVKPGEQIWVMYQKADSVTGVGFWLTRRVGPAVVEDPNYVHLDRVADKKSSSEEPTSARFGATSGSGKLKFGSGGRTRKTSQTLPGTAPYQKIIEDSISYEQFTGEPVPSFSKRCSDLLLEGSNNARIVLGEDRTGAVENDASMKGMGAIDIVVGAGQTSATAPLETGQNTRDYEEVVRGSEVQNQSEGDPDFFNDLSRIYASMNTSGDVNFSTNGVPSLSGGGFSNTNHTGPFVVAKSRHVRVISHQGGGDGTIRIVQIDESGSEKASICIDALGVIQIHGAKIALGSSGATQPYIRFNEFMTLVTNTATAISTHSAAASVFASACIIPVIGPMLAGPMVLGPAAATTTGIAGQLPANAAATASAIISGE